MSDAFQENIDGVAALIGDDTNKVQSSGSLEEGIEGDFEDNLDLSMSDAELLGLRDEWETKANAYKTTVEARQKRNKTYLRGVQRNMTRQEDRVVPTNLLFEATATFVPEALAENPESVVFSDNTDEGKEASNDVKTMLQFHADQLALRRKLGTMVWHWGIYFTAVLKHGFDKKINDITTDVRKPQNFLLDSDGFIDEFGDYKGEFLGERIETSAKKLIKLFPSAKTYVTIKVNGKMGTKVVYTEWWTDDYSFSTYQDIVLDKHKNEFFNYPDEPNEFGSVTPTVNHFATPKMPYTFLSVFSLQEQPHDFTNLIEQNIANQDDINDEDEQINKNLRSGNNSVAISGISFTSETAGQAVQTFYEEGFLLVPDGNMEAVKRIPASPLPTGLLETQATKKETLRSIYGTLGLSAQVQKSSDTARGEILNTNHDSSRIGGGMGDSLEIVAKNVFNWWVQLYCVFYDEAHYGAVMGNARAVEYVQLINTAFQRKFVVSVAPNSMKPKDEVSEQNLAMERWANKSIDPINLMKELDDPDPMNSAKMLVMWTTNPQQYALTFFPEIASQTQQMGASGGTGVDFPNQSSPPTTLAAPEASSALSQVPLATPATPTT